MTVFPTQRTIVVMSKERRGADSHGNDISETVNRRLRVFGWTYNSEVRVDSTGRTYTTSAKIFAPQTVVLNPGDIVRLDNEGVFVIREPGKRYATPWVNSPLDKVGQVIYAERQTT